MLKRELLARPCVVLLLMAAGCGGEKDGRTGADAAAGGAAGRTVNANGGNIGAGGVGGRVIGNVGGDTGSNGGTGVGTGGAGGTNGGGAGSGGSGAGASGGSAGPGGTGVATGGSSGAGGSSGTGGSSAVGGSGVGGSGAIGSGGSVGNGGSIGGPGGGGTGGSVSAGSGGASTGGTAGASDNGGAPVVGTGGSAGVGSGGIVGTGGVGTGGVSTGGVGTGGVGSGGSPGSGGTTGSVLTVCAGGGANFTTIGQAIAAAPAQTIIQVCAGTYSERLTFAGKSLQIVGTAGAGQTTIDAGDLGTAVTVTGTAGPGVTLQGFTIRGGATAAAGGGIRCEGSALILAANIVISNRADAGGGGFYATGCALDISASRFEGNRGFPQGGGALLVNSTGEVRDSVFISNQSEEGGGVAVVEGTVALRRNRMEINQAVLRGGGIHHASTGPIADNVIFGNYASWTGGGVYLAFHALQFTGNTVSNNSSPNDGGGIYIDTGDVTVTNNKINNNLTNDDGGGLRIFSSKVHAEGNVIEDNAAGDSGGGIRVSHVASLFLNNIIRRNQATTGGGIDMDNDSSVVRGGEISANLADRGAGIRAALGPWSGALIEDVVISGNTATWRGGGIALDDNYQPVTLRRLVIIGNRAASGAGLSVTSTDFRISNSLLSGNTASANGGAIYVTTPSAWTAPCPCPPTQATGTVAFLTVYGNNAAMGSALYTADVGALSVRNSILFQNGGTGVRIETGAPLPVWGYNDTTPEAWSGIASPTGSNGNIAADPLFVGAPAGNFHLSPTSPAINAGDPGVLDGDGSRCDMGITGGPTGVP